MDLTATIAQAAGMHELPPEHFDGVSLLPWLLGQSPPSAFHAHLYWHGLLGDVAVQAGGWKLRRSQGTFLFNITHDPLELYSLAQSHAHSGPAMVATLNAKLDQWLHSLPFEARCKDRQCGDYDAQHVRSSQPCTSDEVDPRFVTYGQSKGWEPPYGQNGGNANGGQAACWPAAIDAVRDEVRHASGSAL